MVGGPISGRDSRGSLDVEHVLNIAHSAAAWISYRRGLMTALLWSAVVLGFVLGLRHALDPDHVVAVSTIVSGEPEFAAEQIERLSKLLARLRESVTHAVAVTE